MREPSLKRPLLAFCLAWTLSLAACSGAGNDSAPIPDGFGRVEGTLTAEGDGAPVEGQILMWAGISESPSFPQRPTTAIFTNKGQFSVDVQPGQYWFRATALDGTLCLETALDIPQARSVVLDASCLPLATSSTSQRLDSETTEGRIDGPVFTSPPPPSGERVGMAARVMGTTILDNTGCLMLELEGVRYSIVWPAGTSWQPDPPAVILADGQIVTPGMSVLGAGGYLSSVTHMTGQHVNDAAAACAGPTGEIAIFNLGAEVTVTTG